MRLHASVFLILLFSAGPVHADKAGEIEIDTGTKPDKRSPRAIVVANGSHVDVVFSKLPNEACRFDFKREELKPEPSGVESFIAFLGKSFAPASAAEPAVCKDLPELPAVAVVGPSAWSGREASLAGHAQKVEGLVEILRQAHQDRQAQANELVTCRATNGTSPHCASEDAFKAEAVTFIGLAEGVLAKPTTPLNAVEAEATQALAALDAVAKDAAFQQHPKYSEWVTAAYARFGCASARVDSSKQVLASLAATRDLLSKVVAALKAHEQTSLKHVIPLAIDRDAKLSGSLTCSNFFTKIAVFDPAVPVTITYRAVPSTTFSIGVLYSTLHRRKIGIEPMQTTDAAGFRSIFATQDESNWQVVPFSFLNVNLTRWGALEKPKVLALSAGVGVNAGTGKTEAEFFVGPALQLDRFTLHVGAHIGRFVELGNGFELGATVPDKVTSAPVDRRYSGRLAFAFSYRPRLP